MQRRISLQILEKLMPVSLASLNKIRFLKLELILTQQLSLAISPLQVGHYKNTVAAKEVLILLLKALLLK